jgi:hypothetical protein
MSWIHPGSYSLARVALQEGLGLLFLIAFINALKQFRPLLGERGLLPVPQFVKEVPFRASPSLFFFAPTDRAFAAAAWIGILLSCLVLTGIADRHTWTSMLVWGLVWVIYLSFVNVGQTFYGFGWESILLEAGVYAAFLGGRSTTAPVAVIWMFRWLLFRVMFGAGLIKMRGDPCWRDLTCLDYHYETQPMPNPLSWYFHRAPAWTRKAGVLFNHFAELIVPFGYFLPQPIAGIAGALTIVFQLLIFFSGNLSWLNALTLVLAFSCFDDGTLTSVLLLNTPATHEPALFFRLLVWGLAVLVIVLSIRPIRNLLSSRQIMNTVYNRFHFVGTYGAFGGITRERYEIVIEGTDDAVPTPSTKWREYEFKGKPGDPARIPPQIAPYHLRLDWLMWFAAMGSYMRHPWFVHLLARLLQGDRATVGLLCGNPFPDHPPRQVRAQLYQYQFTTRAERKATHLWWKRTPLGTYFPAVSLQSESLRTIIDHMGWEFTS